MYAPFHSVRMIALALCAVSTRAWHPVPTHLSRCAATSALRLSTALEFQPATRMLHAMIKVKDVNETISFWEGFGAKTLTFRSNGKTENAFVGFGKYSDGERFALELISNQEALEAGNAVNHFGLSSSVIASSALPPSRDPNGFSTQLVDAPGVSSDPFRCIALNVENLEASTDFYGRVLGMQELSRTAQHVQLGCESGSDVRLMLCQQKDGKGVVRGNSFDHLVFSTLDVEKTAEAIRSRGADGTVCTCEVTLSPTKMFGVRITASRDPDGLDCYLIDQSDFLAK